MIRKLFVAALLIGAGTTPDIRALTKLVEGRYRNVQTLRATFLERYVEGGTVRVEAGVVYFHRPGKMRWEYESPEPKLFVSDGRTVWFYVPADRTVVRTPVKESADWRMPFALLTRGPKLSRICSRMDLADSREALDATHAVLRCTPKEKDLHEILIEVDAKSGDIGRVLVREAGGVEIDFRFANWERDIPVQASRFRFIAPAGVAIVDGLANEGSSK